MYCGSILKHSVLLEINVILSLDEACSIVKEISILSFSLT